MCPLRFEQVIDWNGVSWNTLTSDIARKSFSENGIGKRDTFESEGEISKTNLLGFIKFFKFYLDLKQKNQFSSV